MKLNNQKVLTESPPAEIRVTQSENVFAPSSGTLDFLSEQVEARIVNNPEFIEFLAMKMAAQMDVDKAVLSDGFQESPFGEIFIVALQPDFVSENNLAEIDTLAELRDETLPLEFDDGLDD